MAHLQNKRGGHFSPNVGEYSLHGASGIYLYVRDITQIFQKTIWTTWPHLRLPHIKKEPTFECILGSGKKTRILPTKWAPKNQL